jgi:uncharacterized repeat protein (TIGR03806 family)
MSPAARSAFGFVVGSAFLALGCGSQGGPGGPAPPSSGMEPGPDAGGDPDLSRRDAAQGPVAPTDAAAPGADGSSGADALRADRDAEAEAGAPAPIRVALDERPRNATCRAPAPPTGRPNDPFPQRLSQTGCMNPADPRKPAAGVIPFDVSAPLWSDGAAKERFLALPDGAHITVAADGDFTFPVGTVLLKAFRLGDRYVETRLFVRHQDGKWAGYTYEWDEQGKDAVLLPDGQTKRIAGVAWYFPSRKVCMDCHSAAAGGALGPELGQLNFDITYPNGRTGNQLATFEKIGLFAGPLPAKVADLPRFPSPTGAEGTIAERARAYLHSNCANCHRPDGIPADAQKKPTFDLRYQLALADTKACNATVGMDYGFPDARVIVPGSPDLSMISLRMHSDAPNVRMPALGSAIVDEAGVKVVDDWIRSLQGCTP